MNREFESSVRQRHCTFDVLKAFGQFLDHDKWSCFGQTGNPRLPRKRSGGVHQSKARRYKLADDRKKAYPIPRTSWNIHLLSWTVPPSELQLRPEGWYMGYGIEIYLRLQRDVAAVPNTDTGCYRFRVSSPRRGRWSSWTNPFAWPVRIQRSSVFLKKQQTTTLTLVTQIPNWWALDWTRESFLLPCGCPDPNWTKLPIKNILRLTSRKAVCGRKTKSVEVKKPSGEFWRTFLMDAPKPWNGTLVDVVVVRS